jgi:haloalkane dehalogenase
MTFSVDQIKHLYNFQSHFLTLNGYKYHYLDEGQGDPLVMLHGNPSWSFMYRELVRSLRDSYHTVVPDHIGCGLSDKPSVNDYEYTLERRVSDLEALLDQIGAIRNLTLIMHDWGGPIGMTYAARHPSRIRRLIVLNSAAFLLSLAASFLFLRLNAFARIACYVGCRERPMPMEIRHAYTGPYDSRQHRIATLCFVRDIPLTPTDSAYAALKITQENLYRFQQTPMLICWGEKDFVFDRDFLNEWIKRFPNAEVHRFPKAGHYVLEEWSEAIIPLIRNFLASHPLKQEAT